jgi:RNA polymerase sigma-70 factor (ECF subfamily)
LEEIIAGCIRWERSAQKQLYQRFYSYGLTVGLHYAPDRESAEEILHDAFLKVYRNIDQLGDAGCFRSWFRRILVRTAIDHFRRSGKFATPSDYDDFKDKQEVNNEAELQLEKQDVILVLQQLPNRYRMVFNLFVLEEYTHPEIADRLGISIGTSKSNLSRAKAKLRQLMKPSGMLF